MLVGLAPRTFIHLITYFLSVYFWCCSFPLPYLATYHNHTNSCILVPLNWLIFSLLVTSSPLRFFICIVFPLFYYCCNSLGVQWLSQRIEYFHFSSWCIFPVFGLTINPWNKCLGSSEEINSWWEDREAGNTMGISLRCFCDGRGN